MKTRLTAVAAALLALLVGVLAFGQPARAATGFSVADGKLYDANGNEFIMRGVNHAHTWYTQQTSSFANIKALGANTVRVVLSSGDRWTRNSNADVANVISLCKANRLICVLEVHDTTGYGEQSGAITLDRATDYWVSLADVLAGQEKYVIVNIGNEPYGNQGYGTWATDTSNAIKRLRAAGLDHTIMVDAPNWGQDWSFTMRDNASTVFAADPDRNTVFSIHMYGVFDTAAEISDYLGRFRSAGLPIVVGEFGFDHSDGNPDEDTILSYSQANGIGWLGWSWSGNGGGVEYLDLAVNFDPARLSTWGQRLFNGANGIRQTAREATVFGGTTPPTTPPPTTPPPTTPPPTTPPPTTPPPTTPPPTAGCTATYRVVNSWSGGFQGEVTVTAGSSAITGWTTRWTFANGQTVSQSWNATVTGSGGAYTARNVDYNGRLGAGTSTSFGFIGSWNGTNSAPTVSCTAS
ncbi:cellulase family glycosylhydrolase [Micromonospora endolithica]|uniref:Endoglucanase n=1 Tax=Micromonospora endolithica TaxID=230091 RepID=A0A3A9YSY8_9ACTN|nr:cellulase family glycosylhydrolase [Micromonospora endolithica]RKN38407.1 beta-mannosidase [Micromonospora endolithica]TWJ23180.1 mannan endo-1,4-beta-mannosidase [Micromonospora endolithica]